MTDRRWAWVEVDLDAIRHNVRALSALTPDRTAFMAVVKADGYGHGAVEVARAAIDSGADWLGVATVDEAEELRLAGVNAPLLILSEPPETTVERLIELDVVPALHTREFAGALSRAAVARGTTATYHLKIDTGMNRVGVRAEEAHEFAGILAEFPGLELAGTFTHFATADVPGDWDLTRQVKRFATALQAMRAERVDPGLVHAANSAATILAPETHFDLVRCGIALYGLHPCDDTRNGIALRPAMAVKARATRVKRIGIGEGVSYGLTWRAGASAIIATLPLGYADGLHRVLSGRMEVIAGGRRLAQVGRICMDQTLVECGRDSGLERGSEFVIVGSQASEVITLDEIAAISGTINYEMACAFGMRLERIHF